MSLFYTKLFSSITDSSIWSEDSDTKVVWVTMLAMSDQFGRVHAAIPGLAKRANVSIEKTEIAIKKFLSPDQYSRTKDHDGRRIEEAEGGWRLLNHQLYRDLKHADDRKEQNRLAQERRRLKDKDLTSSVSNGQQMSAESAQIEIEANTNTKPEKNLCSLWVAAYQAHFGTKYLFQGPKDMMACKRLVGIESPERLVELAKEAWKKPDGFDTKQAVSIAGFASRYNQIRAACWKRGERPPPQVGVWTEN